MRQVSDAIRRGAYLSGKAGNGGKLSTVSEKSGNSLKVRELLKMLSVKFRVRALLYLIADQKHNVLDCTF